MNYNDITVGIVTFKSEKVIFQCLKSITKIKKIIIFDNSNVKKLIRNIQISNVFYQKVILGMEQLTIEFLKQQQHRMCLS